MKKLILFLMFSIAVKSLLAQITWSGQIASIVYTKCSNCHNSNGIAPFELMKYQDAYENGDDIMTNVQSHKMPPWPPNRAYSRLAHERVLSEQQISDISDWVNNGMPRGDSLSEPSAPVFNTVAEISNPDLVLSAPVYPVNTTRDVYRCFVIPTNLSTSKYLTAIEAVPGDRSVVHHILIYSDSTTVPAGLDAADPAPGYTSFGGTGSSNSKLVGVWVPGQRAYYSPDGMGIRLPAHTNIVVQIHYPGGISGKSDSTKLFLKLTSNFRREITIDAPLNHFELDNGAFLFIPANTTKTFNAHYTVPYDLSTLGVGPHMHLIGTRILSYCVTPGADTIPFIEIPEWDFHWQGIYSFPKVIKIPSGSTIYSEAHYDNTSANPDNPNNPPISVHLGESTTDEMMLVYFAFTPYQNGDENIIIDSTSIINGVEQVNSSKIITPQLYDLSPNPASNIITFQYFLPKSVVAEIKIYDLQGKIIREINGGNISGLITKQINISDLPTGIYYLTLNADGITRTKKIIKE